MTEAQRPQVGEHHYRRAMKLHRQRRAPILLANLAWNLKNQGRMAESRELYEESVALDPTIFQTLYGWAQMEETDRNFARAGELLDAAEKLSPGNPSVLLQRAILHGPRQGLRQGAGRARRHRAAARGRRPRADRMEREGPAARQDGPLCRGLRRLQRGQAHAARADRPSLPGGGGRGAGPAPQGLLRRAAAQNPAARRASASDVAQPIFIVGFPRSGTTMIEQTLERASADQRRRRTADHRRADRPHPAHAEQPARLSGGASPNSGSATRSRGSTTCATIIFSAPASSARSRKGARLVHRQDAAQRDPSRPDRPDLPAGADHPPPAPSARRRAFGLLQPSDARLLLRLRPDEHRPALRAGDGPGRALPARDDAADTWPCATRT